MMTKAMEANLAIVKRFARDQKARHAGDISRIILFGSYAKGTAGPASDFDLLVVLHGKRRDLVDAIYADAYELLLEHGIDISLKMVTEDDFSRKMNMGTPFMEQIGQTGVDL